MRRHMLSILTATSFALMLVTIAAAIHGCFAYDSTGYFRNHWTAENHLIQNVYSFTSCQGQFSLQARTSELNLSQWPRTQQGRLLLARERSQVPELSSILTFSDAFAEHGFSGHFYGPDAGYYTLRRSLFGFDAYVHANSPDTGFSFPAWFAILLFAILPARKVLTGRRRKSSRPDATPPALALA